jgi:hypothetical protein
MKATRRTQPYRRNSRRLLGPALGNMQRGRTVSGYNPKDMDRLIQKQVTRRKKRRRRRVVR